MEHQWKRKKAQENARKRKKTQENASDV